MHISLARTISLRIKNGRFQLHEALPAPGSLLLAAAFILQSSRRSGARTALQTAITRQVCPVHVRDGGFPRVIACSARDCIGDGACERSDNGVPSTSAPSSTLTRPAAPSSSRSRPTRLNNIRNNGVEHK
eukprot:6175951-Pleurochrysis_carterae.AAC.1